MFFLKCPVAGAPAPAHDAAPRFRAQLLDGGPLGTNGVRGKIGAETRRDAMIWFRGLSS